MSPSEWAHGSKRHGFKTSAGFWDAVAQGGEMTGDKVLSREEIEIARAHPRDYPPPLVASHEALRARVEELDKLWCDAATEADEMRGQRDAADNECVRLRARVEEAEAYAKEGWDWLDEALEALGATDVFKIKERGARIRSLEQALADEMGKTVELEDSLAAQKELTHESVERIIELEKEVERLRGFKPGDTLKTHQGEEFVVDDVG